ncbi:MAG: hypothetical protein MIO92_16055, partial [Methanosarcinaceae archaeon]|nr:hypothetical protein [Methanosarcinaceae archaeon]
YDRQLDLLTNLGLNICYVDSHMLPERYVDGLIEAMSDWANRKGLIDHSHYYRFPSQQEPKTANSIEERWKNVVAWLESLEEGGYLFFMHPAKYSRELLLCANKDFPTGVVAVARDVEYRLLLSTKLEHVCNRLGINSIRYDQAELQPEIFNEGKKDE